MAAIKDYYKLTPRIRSITVLVSAGSFFILLLNILGLSTQTAFAATQTLFFRSTTSTVITGTNINLLSSTGGSTIASTTNVVHGKNASTYIFKPNTTGATETPIAITPDGFGWIFASSSAGTYASSSWTFNFSQKDTSATGKSEVVVQVFIVTPNGGGVTEVSNVGRATSTSITPSTTFATTTLTWTPSSPFSLAPGQYLYIESYLDMATAGTSATGTNVLGEDESNVVTSNFTLAPYATAISPSTVLNGATENFTSITGVNFDASSTVQVWATGTAPISCSGFAFTNSTTLGSGSCPLTNAGAATWDVVVTNADTGQFGTSTTQLLTIQNATGTVTILAVGGGGGGGGASAIVGSAAGGGGAGAYLFTAQSLSLGTYSIAVGASGTGGATTPVDGGNGGTSTLSISGGVTLVSAIGGGGGGYSNNGTNAGGGLNGGSSGGAGGGDCFGSLFGGTAIQYEGNIGGYSEVQGGCTYYGGAGGGGIGSAGANAATSTTLAPAGGAGNTNSITGSAVTYAVGGTGVKADDGSAIVGAAGTANTGDGGGGGAADTGGAGGSGIVILSYTTSSAFGATCGGTTSTVSGSAICKFTSSANFVVTNSPAPTVTSTTVSNIEATSATLGSDVTAGASLTAVGICWGTSSASINNCVVDSGNTATGTYTQSVTGLTPNSTIYYEGYAVNSYGTSTSVYSTFSDTPVKVYYSVGQSVANSLMTGSPTITISGGVGTFSIAQTGNLGVGDLVTYTGGSAYISGRTSNSVWSLITATGSTPGNVSGVSVSSIHRAFSSLNGAVNGISGASYLATSSLIGGNYVVNIPCYYDSGSDVTPVSVPALTTSAVNYLSIYTPTSTSQANSSQMESGGVWNSAAYNLTISGNNAIAVSASTDYIYINGLQISVNDTSNYNGYDGIEYLISSGSASYTVSNTIFAGSLSGVDEGSNGIEAPNSPSGMALYIYNNIFYGWNTIYSAAINVFGSANAYAYNNTIYDGYIGVYGSDSNFVVKDIIANDDSLADYYGTFNTASSTSNVSQDSTAIGSGSSYSTQVPFVNSGSANPDLLISPTVFSGPEIQGSNLTSDLYLVPSVDIVGNIRPTTGYWDDGAAQLTSTTSIQIYAWGGGGGGAGYNDSGGGGAGAYVVATATINTGSPVTIIVAQGGQGSGTGGTGYASGANGTAAGGGAGGGGGSSAFGSLVIAAGGGGGANDGAFTASSSNGGSGASGTSGGAGGTGPYVGGGGGAATSASGATPGTGATAAVGTAGNGSAGGAGAETGGGGSSAGLSGNGHNGTSATYGSGGAGSGGATGGAGGSPCGAGGNGTGFDSGGGGGGNEEGITACNGGQPGGGGGGDTYSGSTNGGNGEVIIVASTTLGISAATTSINGSGVAFTISNGNDIWTYTASGTWTPTFSLVPTVSSPTAGSISSTSATLGANVTSNGNAALTSVGICWGTTSATITNNCIADSGNTATGTYTQSVTGLPNDTVIYYEGYATNNNGTGYSTGGSFTTGLVDVYYSVGQSTSTNLMVGSPNLSISNGLGTFSVAQTGNIGVGDKVSYGYGQIAYISGKATSNDTEWYLLTGAGATPVSTTNATVNSITRAFGSLNSAVNTVTGAGYLNNSSLVSANVVLNLACYFDTGSDTTTVTIPAITTSATNYLEIYTPTSTATQVNNSQRHFGKWTSTAYNLAVSSTNAIYVSPSTKYVNIDGLQIEVIDSTNSGGLAGVDYPISTGPGTYNLSDSILVGSLSGTDLNSYGAGAFNASSNVNFNVWNNVFYGWNTTSSAATNFETSGSVYLYNNTAYNNYFGYYSNPNTTTAKNDIGNGDSFADYGFYGDLTSSSTNNVWKNGAETLYTGLGTDDGGIAYDGSGHMWITDYITSNGGSSVVKVTATGTPTTYTMTTNLGPVAIAFDGTNMWTADYGTSTANGSVTKVTSSGGLTNYTIGSGTHPEGIAYDGSNMWVTDYGTNQVSKVTSGGTVTTYNLPAGATGPIGIAYDNNGHMWIADNGTNNVTEITLSSESSGAGTNFSGMGSGPYGIAFDGTNMWVTDKTSGAVSIINVSTNVISSYSSIGTSPEGIAFDGTQLWSSGSSYSPGNMWTANSGSNNVTEISPTGSTTTYSAGTTTAGIAFDGFNMWTANALPDGVTEVVPGGTVTFVSTSTPDLHLSSSDVVARGHGANLTSDSYLPFVSDINLQSRPSTGSWDAGAEQYNSIVTPTVTTPTSASITNTTAVLGANVTSAGSGTLYSIGVCWGYSASTMNTCEVDPGDTSTGVYTENILGLQSGTVIYYEGYAVNAAGVGYSSYTTLTTSGQGPGIPLYFSVGQSSSTNLMTGSPTITISNGSSTFSIAQTSADIGVGDKVTYFGGIAYISGRNDSSDKDYTLITTTGFAPSNVTGAAVTSITHAFPSLNAAVNGISGSSFLATTTLNGYTVYLPCYYDTGPDTTTVSVPALTTNSSDYLYIYTPTSTSQVNQSQRHSGVWSNTAYNLAVTGGDGIDVNASTSNVYIDGLQIEVTDSLNPSGYNGIDLMDNSMASGSSTYYLSNNIIAGALNSGGGTDQNSDGIAGENLPSNDSLYAWNNMVYDWSSTSSEGMDLGGSSADYIYNNTFYGNYIGLLGSNSAIVASDNLANGDTHADYSGTFNTGSSTSNISQDNTAIGTNSTTSVTASFISTSIPNLLLSAASGAVASGANLTSDPYLDPTVDVQANARPSTGPWDDGASELTSVLYPVSGTVSSAVFDTGSPGAAYNSMYWQGTLGGTNSNVGTVGLKLQTSNSPSGPWTNYIGGSTCSSANNSSGWYYAAPNTSISLTCPAFNNNRYFSYEVEICSNDCVTATGTTPKVNHVIVNWSP